MSSQPVSLLAWLKEHEPETLQEARWIFACKDYVRFRLTGEAFAERTDYSGCNFVNLYTGGYDEELLSLFGLSECMEKLLATRNEPPKSIRLAGGAARSPMWTQMFADVMKLPVESVQVNETGAFGCALIGAVAAGDYPDIQTAVEKMCSISPSVRPNPERSAIYDEKYELYRKTIDSLDGLWDSIQGYRDRH